VADATSDDRFGSDPYFAGADRCALLALPILGRGALRAVLLLENRMLRGAFTTDRLDAVNLVAGQLAVSLENARARTELRAFAEEQAALRRVATLVASASSPAKVFTAVTAEIGQVLGVDFVSMLRYHPDGAVTVLGSCSRDGGPGNLNVGAQLPFGGTNVHTEIFRTGRPTRWDAGVADPGPALARALAGVRTSVGVPISVNGRLWGVIVTSSTRAHPLPADIEDRLAGFTELVATAIANADAQAALAASRARVVAAADAARRRVERDLHDGAQQLLVSMTLQLRSAQAEVPRDLGGLSARLDRVASGLVEALDELRKTAHGLHPTALSTGGLPTALKSLGRHSAVPVRLDVRMHGRLPEPVELTAYYSVAEALTNAAKHAQATVVDVRVKTSEDHLLIQVHDDGRGGADLTAGTGLISLTDRIEAVGGHMTLHSPPGAGTTLRIRLPLDRPERSEPPLWGSELRPLSADRIQ
jgi:signal transduction histidine kinase